VAKLVYTVICSLDGYTNDAAGKFDWAFPGPEVHAFVNDLERDVGTYLYGRRLYETMAAWQTLDHQPGMPPEVMDYATIWRGADKVVYSRTLREVSTPRTRLEPAFDADQVRRLKADLPSDLSIGGATLAAGALRAGLIDECRLIVAPHVVGGGTPVWPVEVRLDLELLEQRRFANGMVYLRYRI
jgi:dihydrofolate reductase